MSCYQIKISGLVQGVFLRYSAKQKAEKLGLVGYAKNLENGSVEIVVCPAQRDCGDTAIKEFINWCRIGPDLARVDNIKVDEISFREYNNFQVL
ncbi:MAG: acylphosphatase [Candidatus Paceibacterota bacterium]